MSLYERMNNKASELDGSSDPYDHDCAKLLRRDAELIQPYDADDWHQVVNNIEAEAVRLDEAGQPAEADKVAAFMEDIWRRYASPTSGNSI